MRRAAAALTCLGLSAALALAPGSEWTGGAGGSARAAECSWARHSKRATVKVRRHGRVRRVTRTRHWWSCEPVAAPPLASPAAPTASTPAPAPAPEAEPIANRLGVKSAEYSYTLSRPSVEAGAVTIELDNRGEDSHNLNLQREGSEEAPLQVPETESQHRSTVEFDLPPGTYRLWCSLPQHEERGMHATLVVGGG